MQTNPLLMRESGDGAMTLHSGAAALEDVAGSLLGIEDEPEQDDPVAEDSEEPEAVEAQEELEETDDSVEDETVALENLDDVAKALGVDPTDLLNTLKLRIKVNGEEQEVTLAEAQKGTQLEADYRKKTAHLAEERRALQAEREMALSQLHQTAMQTAAAIQAAEQMVLAEANSPAMQELRARNPAEWVARNHELQAKFSQLQQAKAGAETQYRTAVEAQKVQQQQNLARHLAEQEQMLSQKLPTWGGETKTQLAGFLAERYGYSPEEIGGVMDHRLILMALDAQKGAQATQEVSKVVQKVKQLPKIQPPGKPKSALTVQKRQIAALKGQLTKTGKLRDAARVIEALM